MELYHGENKYCLRRVGAPASMSGIADVFKLQKDITIVGRAKNKVDFFIDSSRHKALISRHHARIIKSHGPAGEDLFIIYDVSLNGTYLNDVKIFNEAKLKPGDVIIFGHVEGALLEGGKLYEQLHSEFRFKFECFEENVDGTCSSDQGNMNSLTNDFPAKGLTGFWKTPFCSTETSVCHTREKLPLFERRVQVDIDKDFKMMQECAAKAVSAFAELKYGSDEDLTPMKYTKIMPEGTTCKIQENRIRSGKKQIRKLQHKKTDCCSANMCLRPSQRVVSWVQCDDCDKWFHVKCCGLNLALVKCKSSKFHCGCL